MPTMARPLVFQYLGRCGNRFSLSSIDGLMLFRRLHMGLCGQNVFIYVFFVLVFYSFEPRGNIDPPPHA